MTAQAFDILLLLARPAAGKSEVIHYLKNTPAEERLRRFHVGRIEEIDDFPMLYTWFEEDGILEKMGHEHLHTDKDGYFKWPYLWDVLIRRIEQEYNKRSRDIGLNSGPTTFLVEFARGREHGGFKQAFSNLSPDFARQAAILYINVSFAESLRKNARRSNPDKPYSILQHSLSKEKMERLYKDSDWQDVSGGSGKGSIAIQGVETPFVVFENEDDVTTPGGDPLGQRLEDCLGQLWKLCQGK